MAYAKKNYYKKYKKYKKRGKGRWNWARTGSVAIKAAKALAMAYALKDANNIEYKELNTYSVAPVQANWTGTLIDLATINQGIGNAGRIGDSVKLQNLTLRYSILNTGATADMVRVIIWNDKQVNVSSAALLLAYTGVNVAPLSSKNEDTKYQSKVLYDKLHSVNPGSNNPHVDLVLPLNFHQHYIAGSSTLKDGALRMLVISHYSTSYTNMFYQATVSYTDN